MQVLRDIITMQNKEDVPGSPIMERLDPSITSNRLPSANCSVQNWSEVSKKALGSVLIFFLDVQIGPKE